VVADVVDPDAVSRAVADVSHHFGTIDLLVNNAAVVESIEAPFDEVPANENWQVVEVGVRGPMNLTHAVLPLMLDGGGGRIVNINSGAAYRSGAGGAIYTAYGVAKAALAQFTRRIDDTYRDRGVYAFDVAPGVVRTDMTASMPMHDDRTDWTPPSAIAGMVADIADGKLDEVSGRFFRAGVDTIESILAQRAEILERDARVMRLFPIDDQDPLA
jgi:NAD(P)-dependent dehydrogenase (short-subunit alcohol dehydrogenase family)